MSTTETPEVSPNASTTVTPSFTTSGRVKWFNNKAGYGFITVSAGEHEGSDVFVHHSAITVDHEQYRYLVQGEYVNFQLCSVENENHKWQAGAVKGINDGKLMCETRLESRESRMNRTPDNNYENDNRPTRNTSYRDDAPNYRIRSRGPGPREGDEWMLVRRRPPRQAGASSPSKEMVRSRLSKVQPGGDRQTNK